MENNKNKNSELKAQAGQKGNSSSENKKQGNSTFSSGAATTRGENKPSHEGSSGGAKKGKFDPENKSPQGSHANPTTTSRGADSTDKEFRNNQPNASTLQQHKGKMGEEPFKE